ncbi:MAG: DHH family phosphoesterase, partial [Schwartzia sp.]|nr:DHH family phosphoesterase [Schwartzia sp. (in: firmicutes)]
MPRNTSAWPDICILLAACGLFAAAFFAFDPYLGSGAVALVLCLAFFVRGRQVRRDHNLDTYFRDVVGHVKPVTNYAVERLPVAILIVDAEGRLQWSNAELARRLAPVPHPEHGTPVKNFWPELIVKPIWGMTGEYIFHAGETAYRAEYRPVPLEGGDLLMAFYVSDV